ncbi:MAG TPA: universal stress protein [Candidatus Dormibacteraeota bacterium]|nr:universal stress protein [Candidatus Dormibacteraeota bacterium]
MFKRVLVAIDGSDYSKKALPVAIEVARKFEGELFVLHVAEHDRGRAAAFTLETPAEATRLVADAVAQAREAGLVAHGSLVDKAAGHVPQAITEAAAAQQIDLIVMGSRGLSDAQGFLVGSVTHKVIQTVEIPVLVTRGGAAVKKATAAELSAVGQG